MLTLKAAEMFHETETVGNIEISHINKHIDKLKWVNVLNSDIFTFSLIYSTVQRSWAKFHFLICQKNWK